MNTGGENARRVSVVMCTYNGEDFLDAQMESILAQDYPLHEIIVQDDGSTDDTMDILGRYARRNPLVRVFRNDRNLGFNRNFHSAMLRATGEFVAIADQDDVWFPQKVRRQVEAIGTCDVCFSAYYRDAAYSLPLRRAVSPAGRMEDLVFANVIPGHTLLVRRDFLDRPGAWNDDFYYDWWFLVNAHLGRGVAKADEPLNWHRPHENSAIARLHRENGGQAPKRPATWQPYVFGWADLLRLRREPKWQMFYRYLLSRTSPSRQPVAHELCRALLAPPWELLRLCRLCLKHRAAVYPSKGEPEWKNKLRAFFFPAIYAYRNTNFRQPRSERNDPSTKHNNHTI